MTYHASPAGSDDDPGTASQPFRSLDKALRTLHAGDTLLVHAGTYVERLRPSTARGTSSAPIRVAAYPGDRPVVQGLLWLSHPDYWTLDGINVTWGASNSASEHMVKMSDGVGWRITHAEIWGARSYAAILVAGTSSRWKLDHLSVHDTYRSNSTNQDHLVYVSGGAGGGVIERNLFANSPNGRGVKVGPPSESSTPMGNVVIRYNTFADNTGPSNVQLSYGASGNEIYRNIMVRSGPGESNLTAYHLTGTGNTAHDNIGWDSSGVLDSARGLTDTGGNQHLDPGLSDLEHGLTAASPGAFDSGRYAPGDY